MCFYLLLWWWCSGSEFQKRKRREITINKHWICLISALCSAFVRYMWGVDFVLCLVLFLVWLERLDSCGTTISDAWDNNQICLLELTWALLNDVGHINLLYSIRYLSQNVHWMKYIHPTFSRPFNSYRFTFVVGKCILYELLDYLCMPYS